MSVDRIVMFIHAELRRQQIAGLLEYALSPDDDGRVVIKGRLDIAALADAANEALVNEAFLETA